MQSATSLERQEKVRKVKENEKKNLKYKPHYEEMPAKQPCGIISVQEELGRPSSLFVHAHEYTISPTKKSLH
tara:strand:+ start:352 stop:567 length:216 start_codon:yes stop_codon:yes gene_type:complete